MKLRPSISLIVLCLFLGLYINTAHAVRLVSVTMSKDVTKDLEPVGITDTFPSDTKVFHAVVIFDDSTPEDVARGVWVAVDAIETPNYEIASTNDYKMMQGSTRLHFTLSIDKPDFRWPEGHYKLMIYVNGHYITSVPFKVVTAQAAPMPQAPSPSGGPPAGTQAASIVGTWTCQVTNAGTMLGTGTVIFDPSGTALIGQKRYSYRITGNTLSIIDQTGVSVYRYQLSGDTLLMQYSDGTVFQCARTSGTGPMGPGMGQGQMMGPGGTYRGGGMMQPAGNEWQLSGYFCYWSGSTMYGEGMSTYSHTEWIQFDGRGNWAYGSEGSYMGAQGEGFYSGSRGPEMTGIYRIQGNQIFYQSSTGQQGVAQVHMRQPDGRITEIMVDGKLFATSLCDNQ
jgi:hypothetical protein